MKIEKITKLKNGMYQLDVTNEQDETQHFKLSESVLIEHNLYSNKVMTDSELSQLDELANYSKLYTSTLNFISFKMRSEKEVIDYLVEKQGTPHLVKEIVGKLKNLNYINDQIYSNAYVKYQFETNRKGVNVIKEELLKKGIDLTVINSSLTSINSIMVMENINQLIHYHVKVNKNKTVRKLKETILRNLLVKGYDYDDVLQCLNQFNFEEYQEDENLIKKELTKLYTKYQKKYEGFELKNKLIKALLNKGFEYDEIVLNLSEIDLD